MDYEDYKKLIVSTENMDQLSEQEINDLFSIFLGVLPNKGKLYKYRSFETGKSYNHIDSIKDGYIYMPKARNLNDDFDSTIIANPEQDFHDIIVCIKENPGLYFKFLYYKGMLDPYIFNTIITTPGLSQIISSIDDKTGKIDINKVIDKTKGSLRFSELIQAIKETQKFVDNYLKLNPQEVTKVIDRIFSINNNIRNLVNAFSLSESYDIDPMWAFYANNSKGLCIEYDFNKALEMDVSYKRLLLGTFRVNYIEKDNSNIYSELFTYSIKHPESSQESIKRVFSLEIINQLLNKNQSWSFEREWRILSNLESEKLYVDLVSKVFVDERSKKEREFVKLLEVCYAKSIPIFERKINPIKRKHYYEELKK